MHQHFTKSARPGPPNDPPQPGAKPSAPRWTHMIWAIGLLLTLLLLFFAPSATSSAKSLAFSDW
jgi:hypothetical protein